MSQAPDPWVLLCCPGLTHPILLLKPSCTFWCFQLKGQSVVGVALRGREQKYPRCSKARTHCPAASEHLLGLAINSGVSTFHNLPLMTPEGPSGAPHLLCKLSSPGCLFFLIYYTNLWALPRFLMARHVKELCVIGEQIRTPGTVISTQLFSYPFCLFCKA